MSAASEQYPLEIENVGEDTYILLSRGHHDIHEFMRKVRAEGYDWPMGVPRHIWMKTTPAGRDSSYTCLYHEVGQSTRGAWPATHCHEAYNECAYEAVFPVESGHPERAMTHQYRGKDGWATAWTWGKWYPCNAASAERLAAETKWGEPKYQVRPIGDQRANISGDAVGGAE